MNANSTTAAQRAPLDILPLTAPDADMLFRLRNDPFVVSFSRSQARVAWDDHIAWFSRCLDAPDQHRLFYLYETGKILGVMRFERADGDSAVITIYLLKHATGSGRGTEAIEKGCRLIVATWGVERVYAEVLADNERSLRSFAKAGFQPVGPRRAVDGATLVWCAISAD